MKTLLFSAAIISASIFTSCNNETLISESTSETNSALSLNVSELAYTPTATGSRAVTNTDAVKTTEFEEGDALGLFIISEDGTVTKQNVKFTYTSGIWTPDGVVNYYANSNYIAYFPYEENLTVESSSDIREKIVGIYEKLGYKIVFTSALEHKGLDEFLKLLGGKVSALCGGSGVGKSSLINALNPNIHLRTKEVSEKLNRGTHTTRHCEIIALDEKSAIVDTPGFSNVRFDFILPSDVDLLFPEMIEYRQGCKYGDCLHINEDGCEVLNNIDKIDETRYESYIEFVAEALEYKEKVKYKGVKQETSMKYKNNKIQAKISDKKRQASRNTRKQMIYKEIENDADE